MGLEKTVLNTAQSCNIKGAYFKFGTLWIPCDVNGNQDLLDFERALEQKFGFRSIQTNICGDEVAVDFVAPTNEVYSPYLGAL